MRLLIFSWIIYLSIFSISIFRKVKYLLDVSTIDIFEIYLILSILIEIFVHAQNRKQIQKTVIFALI